MTFDEIKTRPGTYTTDNGETMAVVFVGEEIFGVSATRYSGIHLFTLDAAECRNDVWVCQRGVGRRLTRNYQPASQPFNVGRVHICACVSEICVKSLGVVFLPACRYASNNAPTSGPNCGGTTCTRGSVSCTSSAKTRNTLRLLKTPPPKETGTVFLLCSNPSLNTTEIAISARFSAATSRIS